MRRNRQMSFAMVTGFELRVKRTRKQVFLEQMERVVPWAELLALIEPHMPAGRTGRPPFAAETMLRIHCLQQWFNLSDPAMEEALYDMALFREFARLDAGSTALPDESTILRFRHLLERHGLPEQILKRVNERLVARGLMMKQGTLVDATLIAAPASTKNRARSRDPQMHQTRKGKNWYFGMKAHVGADAESGLVHSLVGTAANVADVSQGHRLLHGEESVVFADAGYQGAHKRPEATGVEWQVAMRPGKRRALRQAARLSQAAALLEQVERIKARIRAKVEHVFRVIKCQFGYRKVRYRGLAKNTQQLQMLCALANLWLVRKRLLAATG